MLGIVSMAGNALKAFGNTRPAVKWGVIVLAFLLAAEFVGKEGISLYRDMVLLQPSVEQQQAAAKAAEAESCDRRAKALGGLGSGIGEDNRPEVVKWKQECADYLPPALPRVTAPVAVSTKSERNLDWYRKLFAAAGVPQDQLERRALETCLKKEDRALCSDAATDPRSAKE